MLSLDVRQRQFLADFLGGCPGDYALVAVADMVSRCKALFPAETAALVHKHLVY